jgi:hypothetical protein
MAAEAGSAVTSFKVRRQGDDLVSYLVDGGRHALTNTAEHILRFLHEAKRWTEWVLLGQGHASASAM